METSIMKIAQQRKFYEILMEMAFGININSQYRYILQFSIPLYIFD